KQHSYNERAMRTLLAEIALPGDLHWTETLDITSAEPAEVADSNDDLGREHAFITMALAAARIGRKRVLDSGAPFARPDDYFAEMIKSDAHMTKVRQSLINEAQSIKASEEAKRQRELRKFGKKMQQTKLLERQKSKSSELEKIKEFKKKRRGQDVGDDHGNDFDVEIDSAFADTPSGSGNNKRGRDNGGGGAASAAKRQKRDQKYGFGGKKRHSKSNTRESLDAPYLNSGKGGKGGAGNKRPGKAKRQ
ncbi:eukaryotic rRNA processing, partial [Ramicandelaber brevisporus]